MKVAIIQGAPVLFNLTASLKKVEENCAEAKDKDAELVLFPEAFLSAYPRGLSFGSPVGSRSDEGRNLWLRFYESSFSFDGPEFEVLCNIAATYKIYLVIGVNEKDEVNHTLYCSLLYFNPDGAFIGKHRKIKPTAAERIIWGEGNKQPKVYKTHNGSIGGLICWENYMPDARMSLYGQGVDIYLAPTADQRDTWLATLTHIACEGRCFVLGCNQFVSKDMYPKDLPCSDDLAKEPEIMCRGGSVIISPFGKIIEGPLYDEEGILFADIDLKEVIKARMDMNAAGHYSRPDLFQLKK